MAIVCITVYVGFMSWTLYQKIVPHFSTVSSVSKPVLDQASRVSDTPAVTVDMPAPQVIVSNQRETLLQEVQKLEAVVEKQEQEMRSTRDKLENLKKTLDQP